MDVCVDLRMALGSSNTFAPDMLRALVAGRLLHPNTALVRDVRHTVMAWVLCVHASSCLQALVNGSGATLLSNARRVSICAGKHVIHMVTSTALSRGLSRDHVCHDATAMMMAARAEPAYATSNDRIAACLARLERMPAAACVDVHSAQSMAES